MAGAREFREGLAKKYPVSGFFIFGHCHFRASIAHQEQGADPAGTPGGWGLINSPALQSVSLLGTGGQPHVWKVAQVLQALKFFGYHGDQDVFEARLESHGLVFGQSFYGTGTRTGAGHVFRVDADPVQAAVYVAIQILAPLEQYRALWCFLVVPMHLPSRAVLD